MQYARGKLVAFDPDQTKAGWTWENLERLGDLGDLETGRGGGQHGQTLALDLLIQMHMATDHPPHIRVLPEYANEFRTIAQMHGVDPGQTQGPGVVMHEHQGGLTAVCGQIVVQPRQLCRIEIAPVL